MYNYDLINDKLNTINFGKTFVQFEQVSSLHGKSKNISENCPDGMLVLSEEQMDIKTKDNKIQLCGDVEYILMSTIFKSKKDYSPEVLQIVTCAITEALINTVEVDKLSINWPNEVLYDNKKICSIITEKLTKKGNDSIVASIYLRFNKKHEDIENLVQSNNLEEKNVLTDSENADTYINSNEVQENNVNIDKIVLSQLCGSKIDREILVAKMLNEIEKLFIDFTEKNNLKTTIEIFEKRSTHVGKKIYISRIGKKSQKIVTVSGIDNRGKLLILDDEGNKESVKYDEYTIRGMA